MVLMFLESQKGSYAERSITLMTFNILLLNYMEYATITPRVSYGKFNKMSSDGHRIDTNALCTISM